MLGAWTSVAVQHAWIVTMLAGSGVIWAAVYMLWMLQRVVFGTKTSEANANLLDLNAREVGLMLPLLALMVFMGVYPQPFLSRSRASIQAARANVLAPNASGKIEITASEVSNK
jgi:NADH-quinone oxidoreductase subunit M